MQRSPRHQHVKPKTFVELAERLFNGEFDYMMFEELSQRPDYLQVIRPAILMDAAVAGGNRR